jgi:hypothetical protein
MECPHSEKSSEDEAESRKKRIIKEYQTNNILIILSIISIDIIINNLFRPYLAPGLMLVKRENR